jgi:hypothetical protein
MTNSLPDAAVLRLDDQWIWDSWVVDDGDLYHLEAPRALGNPDQRHVNATVGHATSRDLISWDYWASVLGRRKAARLRSMIWLSGGDRWFVIMVSGGCSIQRSPKLVITSTTSGSAQPPLMNSSLAAGRCCASGASGFPLVQDACDYAGAHRGPDLETSSETWRDPVVFADPGGTGWHCCSVRGQSAQGATTTV